ncbi:MAG: Rieske 2Fe-2S domain-containing protein [Burkholderiales bacterium]|nr:Rieske 2Fe-2S domain-containing protein [Burkholderiales bacterium]
MAGKARLICASAALAEGGAGVRFEREGARGPESAFVVRFDGTAHAYLNRCAHVPVELDWQPGNFFDADGLYLMCATHGATYDAATGRCAGGPCRGQGLIKVAVTERDGGIYLED